MKKSELIQELQKETKVPKHVAATVVKTILNDIVDSLAKGQRVEIRNFGNFTVHTRKAHEGRNPKTGEKVNLPTRKAPHFKPGLDLQKRVQKVQ